MKIEDKVCTIEQAKKFVELGVVLETEKIWRYYQVSKSAMLHGHNTIYPPSSKEKDYPAPDDAELGVLLPGTIDYNSEEYYFAQCKWINGQHWVEYSLPGEEDSHLRTFVCETEAQSRADALIWLLENKHIKPEDLRL